MLKSLPPKTRNSLVAVVAGTAIALGLGSYFGAQLARGPVRLGQAPLPAGVTVVPAEAVLTLSVTTEASQWQRMRALGNAASRAQMDQQLVQWRDRLLAQRGLNYAQDIQPWVGSEITLAVLPLRQPTPPTAEPEVSPEGAPEAEAETPDNAEEPAAANPLLPELTDDIWDPQQPLPVVAILPIANGAQAQESLTAATADRPTTERDYEGFSIREINGEGDQDLAATVINNEFVVVSRDGATLERVIDAYQAGEVLLDVANYRDAIADVSSGSSFLRFYLNGEASRQVVADNTLRPSPLVALSPLQRNQGIVGSLTPESEGLRIQGVSWLPEATDLRYATTNRAGALPNLLPTQTLLLLSTDNLTQFWESYQQNSSLNPANPLTPSTFEQGINSLTGLDLAADLLAWMDGEFAGSLVSITNPGAEPQVGFVLAAQTSDRPAAEASFAKLDTVMGDRYRFQVTKADIEGTPVTTWVSPFGSLTLTHGWLENDTAILVVGAETLKTLIPKPQDTLADNLGFQATQPSPLGAHNGHFFVDLEELRQLGGAVPLPTLPDRSGALVGAVRQLGITTAIRGDRSTRFDLRLRLYQEGEVSPLPASPAND